MICQSGFSKIKKNQKVLELIAPSICVSYLINILYTGCFVGNRKTSTLDKRGQGLNIHLFGFTSRGIECSINFSRHNLRTTQYILLIHTLFYFYTTDLPNNQVKCPCPVQQIFNVFWGLQKTSIFQFESPNNSNFGKQ